MHHHITGSKSQPSAGQASTGVCSKLGDSSHSTSPRGKVSLQCCTAYGLRSDHAGNVNLSFPTSSLSALIYVLH